MGSCGTTTIFAQIINNNDLYRILTFWILFKELVQSDNRLEHNRQSISFHDLKLHKGPFKYYVIKEVGGWDQKMAIFDGLQYYKSSKRWVGGPKKVKNMMT